MEVCLQFDQSRALCRTLVDIIPKSLIEQALVSQTPIMGIVFPFLAIEQRLAESQALISHVLADLITDHWSQIPTILHSHSKELIINVIIKVAMRLDDARGDFVYEAMDTLRCVLEHRKLVKGINKTTKCGA